MGRFLVEKSRPALLNPLRSSRSFPFLLSLGGVKGIDVFIKGRNWIFYTEGQEGFMDKGMIDRIFCGKCGNPYNRHSWSFRNFVQWQCINHMQNGFMVYGAKEYEFHFLDGTVRRERV